MCIFSTAGTTQLKIKNTGRPAAQSCGIQFVFHYVVPPLLDVCVVCDAWQCKAQVQCAISSQQSAAVQQCVAGQHSAVVAVSSQPAVSSSTAHSGCTKRTGSD